MEPAPQTPKRKVFLALPTYANTMRRDFVLSLLEILWMDPIPDVEWILGTVGGDGVARSRNNLAQQFLLGTDCEDFVTIDVDIGFTRANFVRLLNSLTPARPVMGALYAAKQLEHRWIKTDLPGEEAGPDGIQRVLETGTGLKGVKRSVFEKHIAAFPEIQYFCDGSGGAVCKWDFFSMGVVNARYLSEDYYFDYRCRLLGIPVHVDRDVQVQHEGAMRFPFASNLTIGNRVRIDTLYRVAEALGDTGYRKSDEEVQLALRIVNEKAA